MAVFKSGDLVVLKSGGPLMTIDTVNTDIFDDDKITGVLCAWFVGDKLERVRFDYRAIEPAHLRKVAMSADEVPPQAAGANGDYKTLLDEMADALNRSAEVAFAFKAAPKKPKSTKVKDGMISTSIVGSESQP